MNSIVRVYPLRTDEFHDGAVEATWRCDCCATREVRRFSAPIAQIVVEQMIDGEGIGLLPPDGWAVVLVVSAGKASMPDGDEVAVDERVTICCPRCRTGMLAAIVEQEEDGDRRARD